MVMLQPQFLMPFHIVFHINEGKTDSGTPHAVGLAQSNGSVFTPLQIPSRAGNRRTSQQNVEGVYALHDFDGDAEELEGQNTKNMKRRRRRGEEQADEKEELEDDKEDDDEDDDDYDDHSDASINDDNDDDEDD
ncbi:trigger factor-like [Vigna umbellata]|uniref:trigger factor-like n=1 Tax=Vigna umbellata TaxID=87088 RepID=UPI001F5F2C30|nr:trigger factor-like [Vigna umbellata]